MKPSFWSQDMLLLKWPALLLALCLVAGGVWYGGVRKFRQDTTFALRAAQSNREQMATQLRQLEEEEESIRGHINRYRQLQASGVIGDEERLKLVEVLAQIRVRYGLYPLQFDIGQQVVIPLREGGAAGMTLRSSRIKLTLPLLHEEDLSRLLLELRGVGRGLFVVEACSLTRNDSELNAQPAQLKENLSASCSILWLTLKPEEKSSAPGSEASSSGAGVL